MTLNNSRLILSAIALAISAAFSAASAQVSASPRRFSPLSSGYIERARAMTDARNFNGVTDQIRTLMTRGIPLSADQTRECSFLLANAWYELGDPGCLALLADFCRNYPASALAPEARLAIGDWHFFEHNWPDALEAYKKADLQALNPEKKLLYTYREALCLIKTGHFREARPLVQQLRGKSDYSYVYDFYNAYLDYINGDFNKAYTGFSKVPEGVPGLEAAYYMAQIEYSRGQYDQVISRGTNLLRDNQVEELLPELNRIIGLSYFKTDRLQDARPYLRAYMQTNDGSPAPDALYALGAIDYANTDYQEAADLFSQLSDLNDAVGQGANLYLGQCYLKLDNPSSAAMAFEKAYKLGFDPQVTETALYNYVTAVTRGGKVPFSSSSKLLEAFTSRYPNSEYTPEVEAYLASAYYNDREFAKALECINAIRRPDREVLAVRQKVLYQLGVEAVTNGRQAQAVDWLKEAGTMTAYDKPLAAQSQLWLGDALFSLNRYAEAQKAYEAFLKLDTSGVNKPLAYYDLAYAKFKQKNFAGAAADFAKAAQFSSRNSNALPEALADDALVRRADCLYYTGDYAQARTLFSQAISQGVTDADYALYRRALLYGLGGDTKSKLSDLAAIERQYPDSRILSKALLEMAVTYEETGRSDLAADAYKKRLSVAQDVDIDELLRMAEAMHKANRSADLLDVVERIKHTGGLEADEMADLSLYEADALADLGRYSDAEAIYSSLANNPSSLAGSKAAVALAEILLKQKNYAGARDLMESFTDAGTPHQYWLARGFIALADAYSALGEKSLAREYLLSLRDNYPGSESDIQSMISSRLKKLK